MDLKAGKKVQKPIPPAGQTLGKCIAVVDLGTQAGTYKGVATQTPTILVGFELPKHKAVFDPAKGEQVMTVYQKYTKSLGTKANFRKMLDSWFAKPIEHLNSERAKKMLGLAGMIQIEHKKDKQDADITYANIAQKGMGVYPLPSDVKVDKKTENTPVFFSLQEYSDESFNKLNTYLQDLIKKSPEYQKIKGGAVAETVTSDNDFGSDNMDDDLPF